jgi:hypothetical protein
MIDLAVPTRTVGGVDVAGDDKDPFAFWILPPAPRVVVGTDGSPQVTLWRFVDGGRLSGGLLEIAVELAWPQAALDAAKTQLVADLRDDKNRVTLNALPLVGAEAALMFLGKETRPDGSISAVVARDYGTVTPKLLPPYSASFSVALTSEGAALAEAALRSGGAPIGVAYRLQAEALRPAQNVIARVDWGRVYDQFSTESKDGSLFSLDDVRRMTERLVETKAISVQVIQALAPDPSAPAPDTAGALQWIEREIVDRLCRPVMPLDRRPARASLGVDGEMFGVGSAYGFTRETQIERSIAEINFVQRSVVVRTLTQQAHLADLLGGAAPADHITDLAPTSPFFDRVSLHVTTARALASTFTREVVAQFTYGATTNAIQLDAQHADGNTSTWADKSATRTWTLPLDITLADDAPVDPGAKVHLTGPSGQGREATLDLEALLGLRSVQVVSSLDDRVMVTRAEVQQHRAGAALGDPRQLTLAATAPAGTAWFRDYRPGDSLTCTTHHLLKDGRAIDLPPIPVETTLFRLPPPFPGTMTLQIIADDDWNDLQRIVVSIQKSPELPAGTVTFDQPGATAAMALDLPDPADRTYRYRVARSRASGDEIDDWQTSDASVLFVGQVAANKLAVDVRLLGDLELPAAGINTIQVLLQYLDPDHQLRDIQTAIFRARADTFHWEVALKDPSRHTYQYQTTVFRSSGATEVGPYSTSTDSALYIPIVKG